MAAFWLIPSARPGDAVVICATPRCGSGLLCSALWSTGLGGRPDEYVGPDTRRDYEALWGCRGDGEYAERVLSYGTTSNGVFGIKVHAEHFPFVSWLVDRDEGLTALADRVHFARLRRRDSARQAVSAYVANHTGQSHQRGPEVRRETDRAPFDHARIQAELTALRDGDRRWSQYFATLAVQPIELWYEDHLETGYAETTRTLLRSIGIDVPADLAVSTDHLKQADEHSEMLVRRFLEVAGPEAVLDAEAAARP